MQIGSIAAAWCIATMAVPGCAAVLFDLSAATGPMASPGAIAIDFSGAGSSGNGSRAVADFRIRGYSSLDGADNGYTDVFTLSHNGVDIYSGSFNLGGGGSNVQLFGPARSRFIASTPGAWQGGIADLSVPLTLSPGNNILGFRYDGVAQGMGDEAWGLDSLKVATGAGAVPEPANWAMLIAGFLFIGIAQRARRRSAGAHRAVSS